MTEIHNRRSSDCVEKEIFGNKRRMKLLSDLNEALYAKKEAVKRNETLEKEMENLKRESEEIKAAVERAWDERIKNERGKTFELESELKKLRAEIMGKADTPGFRQAMQHADVQRAQIKQDVPSARANYKNTASRLQREIRSLRRRLDSSKLALIDETKKKSDLETEVRELRTRLQQSNALSKHKFKEVPANL